MEAGVVNTVVLVGCRKNPEVQDHLLVDDLQLVD